MNISWRNLLCEKTPPRYIMHAVWVHYVTLQALIY